jgi:FkbM family methyltransferase
VNERLRSLLIDALRFYLVRTPINRGRRFVSATFFMPLLPKPPASFVATLPGGGIVRLLYTEALGLTHFTSGAFEEAEIHFLRQLLSEGQTVIDVGANIGYFTVSLALAVGPSGRVFACEPERENQRRLEENIRTNGLTNVVVVPTAIGDYDGEATLSLTNDSAYHTTAPDSSRLPLTVDHDTGERVAVRIARLDTIWRENGSPPVALVKIDVEATELSVLAGARQLLESNQPALLIETHEYLAEIREFLEPFEYSHRQPDGFETHNHFFEPR